MWKRARRLVIAAVVTLAAWVGTAITIDVVGSRPPPSGTYDAIIVLGCRVLPSGEASPSLARRAREGARLFLEGRAPRLVTTGGVGTYPPSEAHVAAAIAREAGVPVDALVVEDRSTSTDENARFARALVPDARRVLVVTDSYHAVRARRFFARRFDEVDVAPVTASRRVRARGAVREVPLLAWQAIATR